MNGCYVDALAKIIAAEISKGLIELAKAIKELKSNGEKEENR